MDSRVSRVFYLLFLGPIDILTCVRIIEQRIHVFSKTWGLLSL